MSEVKPRRVDLTVLGQPQSKARPRVTSKGTYTPKEQKANAEMLGWEIRLACGHEPFVGPVAVGLIFYRGNRQRIDVDNLVKQILDAANGVAWADDAQVVGLVAKKRYDPDNPRTVISICNDYTSNFETPVERLREATCPRCAADFKYMPFPSVKPPRYCSQGCRATGVCEECDSPFEAEPKRPRRFCSAACRERSKSRRLSAAKRAAAPPKPRCQRCGKELKRKDAVLCREHWLENTHQRKRDLVAA